MTPEEANQLRLIAAEAIYKLYCAGQHGQLNLLEMQCDASLDALEEKKKYAKSLGY